MSNKYCALTGKRGICIVRPDVLARLCNADLTETTRKKQALEYFENGFKLGDLVIREFCSSGGFGK